MGPKKLIAGTKDDKRFHFGNRINNDRDLRCTAGTTISAEKKGDNVKISCGCNITKTTNCSGIFDHNDALSNFFDFHREKK